MRARDAVAGGLGVTSHENPIIKLRERTGSGLFRAMASVTRVWSDGAPLQPLRRMRVHTMPLCARDVV